MQSEQHRTTTAPVLRWGRGGTPLRGVFRYHHRPLPAALVQLATVFDALAIVCYQRSCDGQLAHWAAAAPGLRAIVMDGAEVDTQLGLRAEQREHHSVVSLISHCEALLQVTRMWSTVANVLVLEADYAWVGDDAHFDTESLRTFIHSERWEVIRLGYSPIGVAEVGVGRSPLFAKAVAAATFGSNSTACPEVCWCKRVARSLCAIHSVPGARHHCDVRSRVAYAIHRRAFDKALWWRSMALNISSTSRPYNLTNFKGDKWMAWTPISPLHFAIPGVITDGTQAAWKASIAHRMKQFGRLCVSS